MTMDNPGHETMTDDKKREDGAAAGAKAPTGGNGDAQAGPTISTGLAAEGAAATAGHATAPAMDRMGVMGHVVWLMNQSPIHKHMFIGDLEWLVMPALMLGQFRIWHETDAQGNKVPVAFASWAYLDDEAAARLKEGVKRLRPTDWKSGEQLWMIDMIAPFGAAEKAIQQLREQVFKGQPVKSLQPAPDGKGMAVVEW